ncbi:hypothetical protein NDU88_010405 [Pleurodeles waltl]|uniref:Uncharacterized protein n=1 Tax=Pleurodeles waltl TaxID=8319 RepID=A0AAV7R069_PLEWA|nr:hypothetical protein NDU88_010405 [Pleurodeles waltl]
MCVQLSIPSLPWDVRRRFAHAASRACCRVVKRPFVVLEAFRDTERSVPSLPWRHARRCAHAALRACCCIAKRLFVVLEACRDAVHAWHSEASTPRALYPAREAEIFFFFSAPRTVFLASNSLAGRKMCWAAPAFSVDAKLEREQLVEREQTVRQRPVEASGL